MSPNRSNVPPEYLNKQATTSSPQQTQLLFTDLLVIYQTLINIPGVPSSNRQASIDKLELVIRAFTDSLTLPGATPNV